MRYRDWGDIKPDSGLTNGNRPNETHPPVASKWSIMKTTNLSK